MSATAQATNATETLPPAMATTPEPCVRPNGRAAAAIAAKKARGCTASRAAERPAAQRTLTRLISLNSMRTSFPDTTSGRAMPKLSAVAPAAGWPEPRSTRRSPGGRGSSPASPSGTGPEGSDTCSVRWHRPVSARLSHAIKPSGTAAYATCSGMHVGADVGAHVSPAFDGAGVGARVGAATATPASVMPGLAHGDARRHLYHVQHM